VKSAILTKAWLCACLLMIPFSTANAENLLPPTDDAGPWYTKTWSGAGGHAVAKQGKDGGNCFLVEAKEGGDLSWSCSVDVEPGQAYLLSGWIRTEDVDPGTGRGALLNIHEAQQSGVTEAVTGTSDWTRVETIVRSGDKKELLVNCLLGGWGQATGRAWFDRVALTKLDLDNLALRATIRADQTGEPISPFIYSQFIEHLGRCIYGGIWAEMLEDRKFYYPVTENYDPYKGELGGKFPVVGASPWEILGDARGVTMIAEDSFVGDHTPQVASGVGIRQNDLGVVEGKSYVGYVWLKAVGGKASAEVTLACSDDNDDKHTTFIDVGPEYAKHEFQLQARADTDKAKLELQIRGAPCLIGTVSLMPADNVRGMRADTLALLKQLDAPMYRWPGGNFVSGYNWRDGIGDRDRRPPRVNPAWTGVEHNDYGIDEFIDFCREVDTEPMIAANTGYGDAYSAAQEVEYCNGTTDTIGGSWRAKNGNTKPYNVKYWCVGNEMFGPWQLGFMQLKHYAIKHNRVATAMWDTDPTIELVGVGAVHTRNEKNDPGEKRFWSEGMLEQCADKMTYLSEHFYVGRKMDDIPDHVSQLANSIRRIANDHRKLQARLPNLDGRIVPIAMDEWNYWYHPYEYGELGCVYELRDALGVAVGLHEYFRNSDIMKMAHYAQTVNVIGCIKTTKTDAFLATTALPLMLYRKEYGTVPVTVTGNCSLLGLDVTAAWTEDRKALTIGLVNPNADQKVVALNLPGVRPVGKATVWRIAGEDPKAFNTVDKQPVAIRKQDGVRSGDSVKLAPYSVTLVRLPVGQN
jgi:alpha-L-arabinofuranosidase